MDLVSILITPQVLAIAAATVAVIYFLGQIPLRRSKLVHARWWRRILPLLPLAIGVVMAFLPGVLPKEVALSKGWGTNVLVGLWSGLVASHGRAVFKRLVLDKLEPKE
jgi:hypothetical protein